MKILRLKHWQLFLITFGIPFAAYMVGIFLFAIRMAEKASTRDFESAPPEFSDFAPIMIGAAFLFAGAVFHYTWLYQIATKLQSYMHPEMRKLRVNRFRIFFFSPLVYLVILSILLPLCISQVQPYGPPPTILIASLAIIIPGHLYAAFCMIYVQYFTAKTIKSAELQREAHFSDYIGEFFLVWFYFVGVWILQPKINQLVGTGNDNWSQDEFSK